MISTSIDWTARLEPDENRRADPWLMLPSMKPDKFQPEGALTDYMGTRFELFCMYLPRKGIPACEPIKAYAKGHFKMVECRERLYLTVADGVIYEMNKPAVFYDKNQLSTVQKRGVQ